MTLPPIEETPLVLIRFSPKASLRLIELVEQRLTKSGLIRLRQQQSSPSVLYLTTTQEKLEETAEHIHLMKLTSDTNTIEYFTVKDRKRFCHATARWPGMGVSETRNVDQFGMFCCNDWVLLIRRILDNITVLDENQQSSELSQILDSDFHADYHVRSYDESKVGYFHEFTSSFNQTLKKHGARSACLRHVLTTYGIIEDFKLAHFPSIRLEILNQTWWPWFRIMPPVDEIQDYYGWEISFYFAWMGFMSKWLLFPGILGLLVFLFRIYRKDNIDEDEFTPFYGLVTFVWGVFFLRFWERHENRLAYQWGTYSLSPYERQKFFSVRPQFRGYLRRSPVTGLVETYYPPLFRRLKYIVSSIATFLLLGVAAVVVMLSLNAQGYIHPDANPKRWDADNPHPFYIHQLAVLSQEGQLFDSNSSWRPLLPVVLQVICIFILNNIYGFIGRSLTDWENHETGLDHKYSLILKRFLFEACTAFGPLFYLAFYERDVDRLRLELVAIFQIDTLRRVLLECIVPIVFRRLSLARDGKRRRLSRSDKSWRSIKPTDFTLLEDLGKPDYEQFDDFMEIVIQLGYVTLFASAYPLASLISIVANLVEIRSDCFKLTHVCSRPETFRSSGLGMWRNLMACVIWGSALTNCMIAGFTSGQMTYYLPDFYIHDESGIQLDEEDGWLLIFVIFGLEHMMLLIGMLIYVLVPAVPEDVLNQIERRQYERLDLRDGKELKPSSKPEDLKKVE